MGFQYYHVFLATLLIDYSLQHLLTKKNISLPLCTRDMYNDDNAYWACKTLDALQNNWFPSPIAGLYSYLDWNGFDGFWQNGVVLETLANFMHYTNSTRYKSVLQQSWRPVDDLVHAYYPLPSCDDELWFGLAFARIYEVLGDRRFLDTSRDIFNWTWTTCWDYTNTCNGGMFFGAGHGSKITITNGQTILLGAKLYRLTNVDDYLDKSLQVVSYMTTNQVLHPDTFLLSDSLDVYTCEPNDKLNYTYNSGMTIAGLTQLYLATNKTGFLNIAHSVAKANIHNLSHNGILTEYCDLENNCAYDLDAHAFKGIFVRSIRYLMDVSKPKLRIFYQKWIQNNIDYVLNSTSCAKDISMDTSKCNMSFIDGQPTNNLTGPVFATNWHGPFTISAPAQQTQALDLLIAGIGPQVSCNGPHCNYDPKVPNITQLTCKNSPCPANQQCCAWGDTKQYFTCCASYQYCYLGGCY